MNRHCLTCRWEPDWKNNQGKCKWALAHFEGWQTVLLTKYSNPDEIITEEGSRVVDCTGWDEKNIAQEFDDAYNGVHNAHCCKKHGCKYLDHNCPVVNGDLPGIVCEECMSENNDELRNALIKFLSFVPEAAFPSDYQDLTGMYEEGDNGAPFMSETFLYNAIGKEDARTVLALFRQVCKAAGYNMRDLEIEINRKNNS